MKIVFLSYLHGFGGAEKQNVLLANAMAEKGHDVTLISICVDNNCYSLDEKVRYLFIPDRGKSFIRIFARYQDIRKTLETIKPDITVNFWFQTAYLTAMMEKNITGRIVYSERGDPGDKEYSGLLGLIRKLTLPIIDGFVFQSKGAQSYFSKTVQVRSVIIPNPVFVDIANLPPIKKRKKTIVTVGRLHPQKNQKLLIDAFAMIANKIPDYTLEIYGDGELKNALQEKIDGLGLKERVFLKGTSKQIYNLIYDASLFVLTSDYEGLPNTLLEAMALGIPCISTDCRPGGAREIITDGVDGIIVPLGHKAELANAIKNIIKNQKLSEKIAIKAVANMKRFQSNKIYDQWNSFFQDVCSQKVLSK